MRVVSALRSAVLASLVACSPAGHGPPFATSGDAAPSYAAKAAATCACAVDAQCVGHDGLRVCSDGGAWAFSGSRRFPPPSCGPPGALGARCPGGSYDVCAYASTTCDGPLDWLVCSDRTPDAGPPSDWIWQRADATCAAQCPKATPPDGAPCAIEPMYCGWPAACGANDYAFCEQGQWKVTVGACACGDPLRATAGSPCASPGAVCIDPSPTPGPSDSALRIATCSAGQWTEATEALGSHCPTREPAASDPCSKGDACAWQNACGGWTHGTCGVDGLWRKDASPCPGTALAACSAGAACEPRSSCTAGGPGCNYLACHCASDGTLTCDNATCPN